MSRSSRCWSVTSGRNDGASSSTSPAALEVGFGLGISVFLCTRCSPAVGVSHPVTHRKQLHVRLLSVSSHDAHMTTCGSIPSTFNRSLGESARVTRIGRVARACVTWIQSAHGNRQNHESRSNGRFAASPSHSPTSVRGRQRTAVAPRFECDGAPCFERRPTGRRRRSRSPAVVGRRIQRPRRSGALPPVWPSAG